MWNKMGINKHEMDVKQNEGNIIHKQTSTKQTNSSQTNYQVGLGDQVSFPNQNKSSNIRYLFQTFILTY